MSSPVDTPWYPAMRRPLQTAEEIAHEPAAFPSRSSASPFETAFPDWRHRLTRNLARRSDGRWEPLTRVHGAETRGALDATTLIKETRAETP